MKLFLLLTAIAVIVFLSIQVGRELREMSDDNENRYGYDPYRPDDYEEE